MSDGDDTVDDIAMNSAVAAEATTSLKSILYGDTANDTNKQSSSTSPRKPKFGVHDDSPLKIAMDQFPGSSNNNIEEGLVQQQPSTSPPPQSSKRASSVGLGSIIPKRDSFDNRLSSRVSFDDNAPSVKEYATPKRDSLDHNRMMKARLSTVSKMYGKFIFEFRRFMYVLYANSMFIFYYTPPIRY